MGEISGKLLGIVATIGVFIVAIMIAIYPTIETQGKDVGSEVDAISTSLTGLETPTWSGNE